MIARLAVVVLILYGAAAAGRATGEQPPSRLSETGLYVREGGELRIDPRNRPFSPQYPLWSDGARKSRWLGLPPGAAIDVTDVEAWEFPAGTRFWKEFEFGGRRIETRMLWKMANGEWGLAAYAWDEDERDAVLVPPEGVPSLIEVAPGRRHSIPSIDDCRACHDTPRTEVLGFTALQLSVDRDPGAPHAEPLAPEMITTRTLLEEGLVRPARPELLEMPPRIPAADARTRAVLGTLSANCGNCHNARSSLASLGLLLRQPAYGSPEQVEASVRGLLRRTAKWQVPHAVPETSAFVTPGVPDLSAILVRMRSRRPSTQMPPLGTTLPDRAAIDLLTGWIEGLAADDPGAAPLDARSAEAFRRRVQPGETAPP